MSTPDATDVLTGFADHERMKTRRASSSEPSGRVRTPGVALALLLVAGCALLARPEGPPDASESARRLVPGPHDVASADVELEDRDRGRALVTTVWWPKGLSGAAPLLV